MEMTRQIYIKLMALHIRENIIKNEQQLAAKEFGFESFEDALAYAMKFQMEPVDGK